MKSEESARTLAEKLAEMVGRLLGQGFEPPIYGTVTGVNGYISCFVHRANASSGGLDTEYLFERDPAGTIALPINVFFVDARGVAARLLVTPTESALQTLN